MENPKQILQSAMDCKEYSDCNCIGCPHTEDGYYGDRKSTCFDAIMDNSSTDEKAEMMVQMYLMGGTK